MSFSRSLKFSRKNIENWWSMKMTFFWLFLVVRFFKKTFFFAFFPMKISWALFLHYGWFLQNLGKDFIRTNMHMTLAKILYEKVHNYVKVMARHFCYEIYWSLNWDSRLGRDRKTSLLLVAFWNFKLKVLEYPQNCRLHVTLILKV